MSQSQLEFASPSLATMAGAATAAPDAGLVVWHDLMSTDVRRSTEFYTALFGWSARAVDADGGAYTMLRNGDTDVAGIVPLGVELAIPSHWIPYVAVSSADDVCARTAEIGGTVCVGATDVPNVGRFAVIQDPTGGVFSPIRTPDVAPEPAGHPDGAFAWDELLTRDPEGARAFYTSLLGWESHDQDMSETGTYHLFTRGERLIAGMTQLLSDVPTPRAFWLPYVHVADVNATARRFVRLGGVVHFPPTDIPGVGRVMVGMDPTGASIAAVRFVTT